MFYTYFSARGVDVSAYTSAPLQARLIAHDAPSFDYVKDAEAWISEVAIPKFNATKEVVQ